VTDRNRRGGDTNGLDMEVRSDLENSKILAARPATSGRRPAGPAPLGGRAGAAILAGVVVFATAVVIASTISTEVSGRDLGVAASPSSGDQLAASVGVARLTYAAGHSSGWHVHPGVHSVVVLAGTLTVYDERCGRQDYGPGDSYVGGSRPHMAHNETPDELTLVVTSVYRQSSTGDHGSPVPAPEGCEA
jgi:quercetin dioxygenase-like cupin family protein